MNLKCDSCESLDPASLLSLDAIQSHINSTLRLWTVEESSDVYKIHRKFTCRHFEACIKYINDAAAVCESLGHHADFHLTSWREMEVQIKRMAYSLMCYVSSYLIMVFSLCRWYFILTR